MREFLKVENMEELEFSIDFEYHKNALKAVLRKRLIALLKRHLLAHVPSTYPYIWVTFKEPNNTPYFYASIYEGEPPANAFVLNYRLMQYVSVDILWEFSVYAPLMALLKLDGAYSVEEMQS